MCFALVCTIGMLKFTGQSDRSKNKHMFTQSLYITFTWTHLIGNDEVILSNHATYTLLYFSQLWTFECGKAQSHSSMHSKRQQQPTLLFLHFVLLFFSFFWTFESKFEQNWVVFDTLINNAKHWSTVNKMTVGRQNRIHSGLPQPSDVIIFCFSFTFIMTCSEQMTTVKWQKSEKKWKKEQNWAKLSRICQGPNTYFSILSNFEQNWAILSNFEQNWAGFTGTYQYFF